MHLFYKKNKISEWKWGKQTKKLKTEEQTKKLRSEKTRKTNEKIIWTC
jgi:hypothetical protein